MNFIRFIKNWTLPLAMLAGVLVYLMFAHVEALYPLKPYVRQLDKYLTPGLIFIQLLLSFCKVNPSAMRFTMWHVWLMLIQLVGCTVVYLALAPVNVLLAQSAMVVLICPTATAAAVITQKLGGDAASLVTYTILSNVLTAVYVPCVFPLVYVSGAETGFISAFLTILAKIFPLLLSPLLLAFVLRWFLPSVHCWLRSKSFVAFYIWAVALAMVMGKTAKSIVDNRHLGMLIVWMSLVSLLFCCLQFAFGKMIGGRYGNRISGGQAIGQKNTVFAIWLAQTFLNPITSVAPGAYVLWQNSINSWQLWKKRKHDNASAA